MSAKMREHSTGLVDSERYALESDKPHPESLLWEKYEKFGINTMRNDPSKSKGQIKGRFEHQWGKPRDECEQGSPARLWAHGEAEGVQD